MSNDNVIESFLQKVDELSKHIENDKEILLKKKEELENQTKTVNQLHEQLQLQELEYHQKLYKNAKAIYIKKKLLHHLYHLSNENQKLKQIYHKNKLRIYQLQKKQHHFQQVIEQEEGKWKNYVETTVRLTVDYSQSGYKQKQLQIQEKQKTVEKLKQLISSLQDDLEVLSLEKVVQQDEYNTVTTEWKQKQEQIIQLNQKHLALNQEFNRLRQELVEKQKEQSLQRNQFFKRELEKIGKTSRTSQKQFKTAAEHIRSCEEEW